MGSVWGQCWGAQGSGKLQPRLFPGHGVTPDIPADGGAAWDRGAVLQLRWFLWSLAAMQSLAGLSTATWDSSAHGLGNSVVLKTAI